MTAPDAPLIEVRDLRKEYHAAAAPVWALDGVSLDITQGEFVAIMGRSGSGKSTFMNILGTLDRPTSGTYRLDGHDVSTLRDSALSELRSRSIGFVFQNFNLIPRRTVLDNVSMPLLYSGKTREEREEIALSYLRIVEMGGFELRRPDQLSGGQQQRVAIARALSTNPRLILADEPTGNLDTKTAGAIMELLTSINQSRITIVLVTHELKIAASARRVIHFKDGKVLTEDRRE